MCSKILRAASWYTLLIGVPLVLAIYVLGLKNWDMSIPLLYNTGDAVWQFTLTKVLHDSSWILTNPYLGAPEVASWHHNAAAQTSALHSVLMLALSPFVDNSVELQQIYYLINFPLICLTSFFACRLLGIHRIPAFCVGLLFAFTSFRIGVMLYAYLVNYFMVPLALVSVIWILTGKFASLVEKYEHTNKWWQNAFYLLRTKEFILGLIFVTLSAASDGYYAFFTLLLLGFAVVTRLLLGDWRHPLSLLPVGIYIVALFSVSLSLQIPLYNYKKTHWNEFYPNGIEDPSLLKHSAEAEIYSATLKTIISPIPTHHIHAFGKLGQKMVATSEAARAFKTGPAIVPLGSLGSILFIVALGLMTMPTLRRRIGITKAPGSSSCEISDPSMSIKDALLPLSLFIFLFSIIGGLGTLVALVFPTIRAYDRFPLFLIFVLYLGFAWFISLKIYSSGKPARFAWIVFTLLITTAALYDQIPNDANKGNEQTRSTYLAERSFVHKLELALAPNAMVYQYPYSNYLRDSKYYGWGSFAHVRLYLHSQQLRWSNGGAKNSPADDWNLRISQLPIDQLLVEVESAGFKGFVIDQTVIKGGEYERIHEALAGRGYEMLEDIPSKFTFVKLRDPGFQLFYDSKYHVADRAVITNRKQLIKNKDFPICIDGNSLKRVVTKQPEKFNLVINRIDYPEIFKTPPILLSGLGHAPIIPISSMLGKMNCKVETVIEAGGSLDTIALTLENHSNFDWKLNDGPYPIRIGVHLRTSDGKLLTWDDGFRFPTNAYISRGMNYTIRMPLKTFLLIDRTISIHSLVAEFVLVQDGHAWFSDIACSLKLR